jgi:hypothetical protein
MWKVYTRPTSASDFYILGLWPTILLFENLKKVEFRVGSGQDPFEKKSDFLSKMTLLFWIFEKKNDKKTLQMH